MKTLAATDLAFFETAPVRITASTTLTASPDRVFDSFAAPTEWPRWWPLMKSAHWTKGTGGVGAEREVAMHALGRFRERMIAWEPGRRFAFTMIGSTSPLAEQIAEDYRLSPDGKGTRVDWLMVAVPSRVGRFAVPALRVLMQKSFARGTRKLERLLTSN